MSIRALKAIKKIFTRYKQFAHYDYVTHTKTYFAISVEWLKDFYVPTYKSHMTYKQFCKMTTNDDLPFLMLIADKNGEFHLLGKE